MRVGTKMAKVCCWGSRAIVSDEVKRIVERSHNNSAGKHGMAPLEAPIKIYLEFKSTLKSL